MKIIGNTVGTPLGLDAIKDKLNPLTKENLGEAVNGALAQAKASGEFDGAPGKDGKDGRDGTDGKDGKDGYTPQKGIDYFDGKDGEPGKDGKDGERGPIGVTGAQGPQGIPGPAGADGQPGQPGKDGSNGKDGNGIKSAVLNADYTLTLTFDDGSSYTTPSIRGETGATGATGPAGPTGPAYTLTAADKSAIVNAVIAALPVYNGEVV